jgi:thiosulfate/3-mercaptopyruvate sulfurtransferase
MKNFKLMLSTIAAILFLGTVAMAQPEVITADMFKTMLDDNIEMVILDANKTKGYKAAHLQGAVHINHNDLYMDGDIKGMLKTPEELAMIFGKLGVGDNIPVVVTDDGTQKYSLRVNWILNYLGYDNVKVLHKDKTTWRKARLSLTSKVPKTVARNFTVNLRPEFYASISRVEESVKDPGIMLVDVRTPEEYNGDHKNSDGHIPGAINLNYEELLTESGDFKPKAELMAIAESLGLTPDKEMIFYCRTSTRAGVPFYAFRYILGYDNIKVYDGAYLEWSAKKDIVQ